MKINWSAHPSCCYFAGHCYNCWKVGHNSSNCVRETPFNEGYITPSDLIAWIMERFLK
ncbi:hypothetical protein GLOIN_2v1500566 [Rhizophagus irregularis DAOM 181602=DAOM 197198]|nr:hypothetical protein GLOIN_2v1500566 [Rhizophagus irregularis DAOM 181602=DAOM 197198]